MELENTIYLFREIGYTCNGSYANGGSEENPMPSWHYLFDEAKREVLKILPTEKSSFLIKYLQKEFDSIDEAINHALNVKSFPTEILWMVSRQFDDFLIWFWDVSAVDDENTETETLSESELKTQKEQIRLLYDLGVIDYLREKYPILKQSNNKLSDVIATILKCQRGSIQPSVNALINDDAGNKNYPKKSAAIERLITKLNEFREL